MKYLILTQPSIEYALTVSECIWIASYPPDVRVGNEETRHYCGYITHPQSGDVALAFPDQEIPVHPLRVLQPLVDTIKAPLPENEQAAIQTHFDNFDWDNTPTTIENVLPPLYADNLKTQAQMEALGWFNNES